MLTMKEANEVAVLLDKLRRLEQHKAQMIRASRVAYEDERPLEVRVMTDARDRPMEFQVPLYLVLQLVDGELDTVRTRLLELNVDPYAVDDEEALDA